MYLKNWSPTKAVDGLTPYETWTGEKLRLYHLRCFRCVAYTHIPKDEWRKLDSKAKWYILVGHSESTKGYMLYDIEKKKAFFSCDIVFVNKKWTWEEKQCTRWQSRYVNIYPQLRKLNETFTKMIILTLVLLNPLKNLNCCSWGDRPQKEDLRTTTTSR